MQKRKKIMISLAMLLCGSMAFGQTDDPVLMTINGKPVKRSAFEFAYKKYQTANGFERKSVADYAEQYANDKLKVEEALSQRLDTLPSFLQLFAAYHTQQIPQTLDNDAETEAEARRLYAFTQQRVDASGGMIKVREIQLRLGQRASKRTEIEVKQRIDSIYNALQHGADFGEMARQYSDNKTATNLGEHQPWLLPGQALPEFEAQAYALKKGEMSAPFLTPAGYHIILIEDKSAYFPYDSVRNDLLRFVSQRNLRNKLTAARLQERSFAQRSSEDMALKKQANVFEKENPQMANLMQEYRDGLLIFEVSKRTIWDKVAHDEAGLTNYFNHNKKKYKWSSPRYKGIIIHAKEAGEVKKVKKLLKHIDFNHWKEAIDQQFNAGGEVRIIATQGLFKSGDNSWIDYEIFKQGEAPQPIKDYPFNGVYGKKLKAPKALAEVRPLVLADYQEELERQWVKTLREKYPVIIHQEVLKTIKENR